MGWLIGWRSKKELIDHLVKQDGGTCEVIEYSVVGNHLWTLCRRTVASEEYPIGFQFIVLCLLTGGPRGTGPGGRDWGYKDIDESMGPGYYDCPVKYLKQSHDTSKYGVPWRAQCLEWRKERAAHKKWLDSLKHGDVFYAGPHKLMFVGPGNGYRSSKNYLIGRDESGGVFRWKKSRASPNPPKEERT